MPVKTSYPIWSFDTKKIKKVVFSNNKINTSLIKKTDVSKIAMCKSII